MDFNLTQEQKALVESVTRFAQREFADKAYTWTTYPWENAKKLAEQGLSGLALPEEKGGGGANLFDALLVLEAISRVCPHSGDAFQAMNFGGIRQIGAFGSARVVAEVLPGLLSGEYLVTSGMSESEAGSALTDMQTTARWDGDDVIINGTKLWNSHGPEGTHHVIWCRFGPRTRDIGAVLVPADTQGFSKGPVERYMSGEPFCSLILDDVRVHKDYVLSSDGALRDMMTIFNGARIGNSIRSVALATTAFEMAVAHAKQRVQFGKRLMEFQGLQWKFADMHIKLEAARLLVYRAASNAGAGRLDATETSVAKTFANEESLWVAEQALQIHGAMGYSTEMPLEYIVRRIRGWGIAGGAVEMQRNRIAAGVFGERLDQRS